MRTSLAARDDIPIYLAALSPKMMHLTGEGRRRLAGHQLRAGGRGGRPDLARGGAGRALTELDLCQGAEVAFAADDDELSAMLARRKGELAFSLGGMGSRETSCYNRAYRRQGRAEVAAPRAVVGGAAGRGGRAGDRRHLDPVPELARLRAQQPVSRLSIPGGPTAWLVTGYRETRAVLGDLDRYSNDFANLTGSGVGLQQNPGGLGMADPPVHTRLRQLLTRSSPPTGCASWSRGSPRSWGSAWTSDRRAGRHRGVAGVPVRSGGAAARRTGRRAARPADPRARRPRSVTASWPDSPTGCSPGDSTPR